jgi:uncharacterized protein (TIGR02145 family)
MLLPRVELSDLNALHPMFTGTYDAAEDAKHTGLTVYNLKKCDGKFAQGVYTWTGTAWVQLTKNPVLTGNPVLAFTPGLPSGNLVRIPSGQDQRPAWTSAYEPSIAFTEASQVEGAWSNTVGGGLTFTTNPLAPSGLSAATTSSPYTWSASPVSDISVYPDAMTAADLTSNPFLTRESKLTITARANAGGPCPGGTDQTQEITLNQTNYAIVPGTVASPISLLLLKATSQQNLNILSNVKWKATASAGTVPYTDILSSYTTAETGGERNDNNYNQPKFYYTSVNPVIQGKKYETAKVTFNDVNGRAKPVEITVMQCQGTQDMSSITTTATPVETSGTDNWGSAVVRHQAKPVDENDPSQGNIYEEFYSADFGAAGRWMTTNLAAKAYDGISHSEGRMLTGPDANNSGDSYSTAYWCYPNGGAGGTTATTYNSNPQTGFLYTWDAATAGKGGTDGFGNTTNEGGSDAYARVQGICPAGWHLPSDYEWTELENAIIANTTDYANVAVNIEGTPLPQDNRIVGERGTTHGQAMKEVCGFAGSSTIINGLSNKLAGNGFAGLLAGSANDGATGNFNLYASFWSSSSNGRTGVHGRSLSWRYHTVSKSNALRYTLNSVRCKKD